MRQIHERTARARRVEPLVDVDADLAQLLPAERLSAARRDLLVELRSIAAGPWAVGDAVGPMHLGLLLVDGVIVLELALSDSVSAELVGPGDVIRPWRDDPAALLEGKARLTVLERTTFAVLDARFLHASGAYPEVMAMLVDRMLARTHRVAAEKAIAQLNGVDRRLLTLFWSLAQRWGRVTADGVVVPVSLPHRVLAQLIGARRPTVSTGLARLAGTRQLVRRDDGTWLLRGDPVGRPVGEATRVVRTRRFSARRAAALRPAVAAGERAMTG